MKSKIHTTTIFILFCSAMGAQSFPHDLDERERMDTVTTIYHLHNFSDHLRTFAQDTVTVEVYFEQRKTTKMPDSSLMAYKSECVQTSLLKSTRTAGSFFYPITRKNGRYILYFFRNGCFVESSLDSLPDGTTSQFFRVWGNCKPPLKTTRI
ncbi:MAG: hypothetical protein K9J37_13615 [Saprospiraceae bacterium]|nr:hypothetical protein [Saprospiraceae bacterium]MCF8250947.1 hypothetical protein [Saprospiraceae bacterium]MCF8281924.1 hypothetical protein [Bacteroidales bacterium]MCF8311911.1 hypothetical protein [Saprospiraceae bacterium]MCF8441919.1 hypothetical protein [Saprospiraceae bacterium]